MNERIFELWNQAAKATAAYPSGQTNSWETQVNFMDKFAELIVREVFSKIDDERFEVYQPVKESVMKHFGVEE
jgi:hypothetical protein